MLEAMLAASGELGYEHVAVRHVIERARTSRATFYKHFEDREDCFAQAHRDACEWLYLRMIGVAKRQTTWRAGLRAALAELLEFCANQPALARVLFVEAHAAGERAPEMLPGLLHFVVMQYFGEAAAWEEMTAAPLATWRSRREAASRIPAER